MDGASIPYPVNYIINLIVLIVFAVAILVVLSFRFHKSQAARARRRTLTGEQCLSLDMKGVTGDYPPTKVQQLIQIRLLREAEAAAEKEYEVHVHFTHESPVVSPPSRARQSEKSRLKDDVSRKSSLTVTPGRLSVSQQVQKRSKDSVAEVSVTRHSEVSLTQDVDDAAETASVVSTAIPTIILPDEEEVGSTSPVDDDRTESELVDLRSPNSISP